MGSGHHISGVLVSRRCPIFWDFPHVYGFPRTGIINFVDLLWFGVWKCVHPFFGSSKTHAPHSNCDFTKGTLMLHAFSQSSGPWQPWPYQLSFRCSAFGGGVEWVHRCRSKKMRIFRSLWRSSRNPQGRNTPLIVKGIRGYSSWVY